MSAAARWAVRFTMPDGSCYYLARPGRMGRRGYREGHRYGDRDAAHTWATPEAAERNIPGRSLYEGDPFGEGLTNALDESHGHAHRRTIHLVDLTRSDDPSSEG